jgi:hypothetical protein
MRKTVGKDSKQRTMVRDEKVEPKKKKTSTMHV